MARVTAFFALTFLGLFAIPAAAEGPPVVVELFTSQGCASCPPANANLIQLLDRPDVLALSFSVTYWDYLGWDDTLASEAFTDRQFAYVGPLGHDGAFTPQMVIDGRHDTVGQDLAEINALINKAAAAHDATPSIDVIDGKLVIGSDIAPSQAADIWLVAYVPDITEVPVARGENRRRVLRIGHAVKSLTHLGAWSGATLRLDLPTGQAGTAQAVLLQAGPGGPILAARKL